VVKTSKKRQWKHVALLSLAMSLSAGLQAAEWKPAKPVEFYVPSGAGGGTDQFARLVQSIIVKHKLMDQNIVVLNKAGGSGAEAFVEIAGAKGDPNKIVFGTNNAYLLPLVVKLPYKFEQLVPVALMAQDEFLLWVPEDAPYKTAKEFLDAARANPSAFRMGGAQSKDTDQTLNELINKANNLKLTYIPFKSGNEVATQLAGKHVSANLNNPNDTSRSDKNRGTDANRDPISGEPGAHPIGTGIGAAGGGAAAGAATGMAVGTVAGPVGTAVGAAVGAATLLAAELTTKIFPYKSSNMAWQPHG